MALLMQASQDEKLGSKRKRKRRTRNSNRTSTSRFLPCPVCGRHVLEMSINRHLDQCIEDDNNDEKISQVIMEDHKSYQTTTGQEKSPVLESSISQDTGISNEETQETPQPQAVRVLPGTTPKLKSFHIDHLDSTLKTKDAVPVIVSADNMQVTPDPKNPNVKRVSMEAPICASTTSSTPESCTTNAFDRMMKQAKAVFSNNHNSPLQQSFYLCTDGSVYVFAMDKRGHLASATTNPSFSQKHDNDSNGHVVSQASQQDAYAWSASVLLKHKSNNRDNDKASVDTDRQLRPIQVSICSNIRSDPLNGIVPGQAASRLVRVHSRLSVPVLKSVLQKSIRRGRAMSAVKVAMELADKSLGDLLRRLPIIILEDSMLHADLPFVVWLMIAHSKGYLVSKDQLERLLRVVYQVASCHWSDHCPQAVNPEETDHGGAEGIPRGCRLSRVPNLQSVLSDGFPSSDQVLLWSILARAEYGGMRGDIQMLHRYALTWASRFSGSLPVAVAQKLNKSEIDGKRNSMDQVDNDKATGRSGPMSWSSIPQLCHEEHQVGSDLDNVSSMCERGIDRLSLQDVTLEGVDFHCSNILDHLLSLPAVGIASDLVTLLKWGETGPCLDAKSKRLQLERMLKSCMWQYCSGINHREILSEDERECNDGSAKDPNLYAQIWTEYFAKATKEFQKDYIQQRLA